MLSTTPISCLLPRPVARAALAHAPSKTTWRAGGEVFRSTAELLQKVPETGPEGLPAQLEFRHRLGVSLTWKEMTRSPVTTVKKAYRWAGRFRNPVMRNLLKLHVVQLAPLIGVVGLGLSLWANLGSSHYQGKIEGLLVNNGDNTEFLFQTRAAGENTLHSIPVNKFGTAPVSRVEPDGQWWSPGVPHTNFTDPETACPGQVDQVLKAELTAARSLPSEIDFEEDYLLVNDIPLQIQ